MPRQRRTLSEAQQHLELKWPGKFALLDYVGARKPAKFRCCSCQHEFSRGFDDTLKRGTCPGCSPSRGEHKKPKAWERAQQAAAAGGVEHVGSEPSNRTDRRYYHKFRCPHHGVFQLSTPGWRAQCPKCRGHVSPNDPELLPKKMRGKACDLYLIEIRDTTGGYFTKVGISTNWASRKRNYAKEGVHVLRELRCLRMTLYEALVIEKSIKTWMRRVLGRRRCPARKWSGWSESAIDPFRKFPAAFDREVALFRARRR